jgi:hypothetical protein
MHVATLALLHRSAKPLADRRFAIEAARCMATRLGRRGDGRLSRRLLAAVERLGTPSFQVALRASAKRAIQRLRAVDEIRLAAIIGHAAAKEVPQYEVSALMDGGTLSADDLPALVGHLAQGAELAVGFGRGDALAESNEVPPELAIEIDVDAIPDGSRAATLPARQIRKTRAEEAYTCVELTFCLQLGPQKLRLTRGGLSASEPVVLEGVDHRLRVVLGDRELTLEPMPLDSWVTDYRNKLAACEALNREIHADPLLADLVAQLYTRGGFGGSPAALQKVLDLAGLIHRHSDVARQWVTDLPNALKEPPEEIVAQLGARLRAEET